MSKLLLQTHIDPILAVSSRKNYISREVAKNNIMFVSFCVKSPDVSEELLKPLHKKLLYEAAIPLMMIDAAQ
jgi:hypothetical protein